MIPNDTVERQGKKSRQELDADEFIPIELDREVFLIDLTENNIGNAASPEEPLQLGGTGEGAPLKYLHLIAQSRRLSVKRGEEYGYLPSSIDEGDGCAGGGLVGAPVGGGEFADD